MALDPFTAEIIKSALVAVGEEMFTAMGRTSMSPIIYEVLDYAVGITDAEGGLIAQGNGVAGFLGVLTYSVRSVLDKFGPARLRPGDVLATNDPYGGGGTHLSDVCMVMPIYFGDELVAFAANKAHWTEVGGMAPGSWTTDATEVFQEGLQFPCIKVYEDNRPVEQIVDLIAANVRTPAMSLGDFYAQAACLRLAGRRVAELCGKYGLPAVREAIALLLDDGERRARAALASLPKGTFTAEMMIDDDGIGTEAIPVRVRVTVDDGGMTADFTGAPPEVAGPINSGRTATMSALRAMWVALTDPHAQINEGTFRPLRLICPAGTLFTAERPAPTSTYWETMTYAFDLVWAAMAPHVPGRLSAGHFCTVGAEIITTHHPDTGLMTILVEPHVGGWGACADGDGAAGQFCVGDGETYNLPVEVTELAYGLRVERYTFSPEPGGEGRWRGGRGCVREYRILSERGGALTITLGRHKFPPWGTDGGGAGGRNYVQVVRADGVAMPPVGKTARLPLGPGDLVRVVTGAGGGWGDPRERPRELVLADLRAGLLEKGVARDVYAVG